MREIPRLTFSIDYPILVNEQNTDLDTGRLDGGLAPPGVNGVQSLADGLRTR